MCFSPLQMGIPRYSSVISVIHMFHVNHSPSVKEPRPMRSMAEQSSKTKYMTLKTVCLIILFVSGYCFYVFFGLPAAPGSYSSDDSTSASRPLRILIINSYDRDSIWTNGIENAFVASLKDHGMDNQYYYEYMSTKRFFNDQYFLEFEHLLSEKYKDIPLDYIVTTDDDATLFVASRQHRIFNRTIPVIYCGINQFYLFPKNFYGVQETHNISKTIGLIRTLQGDDTRILIVTDTTTTSKSIVGSAQVNDIARMDPRIELLMDNHVDTIRSRLSIHDYDALIYFVFNQDSDGESYTYVEGFRLFKPYIKVPVYSNWNFYLEDGQIGGVITSAESQGQAVADTLLALVSIDAPAERAKYKQQILDYPLIINYPAFKEHGLDFDRIPQDALIINKPLSYFEKNRTILMISAGIITGLLLIISILSNVIKKKIMELEKTHLDLLEAKNFRNMWNIAIGLSHELNTDIGNSMTLVSLLNLKNSKLASEIDDGNLTKRQLQQYLHDIVQISRQLDENLIKSSTYIKNIKEKSMILESISDNDLMTINACDTLQNVVKGYFRVLESRGIALQLDCPNELIFVQCNDYLEEILQILMDNAIAHAFCSSSHASSENSNMFTEKSEAPTIMIRLSKHEDRLHIHFGDNGDGISDLLMNDLFSPMTKGSMAAPGEGMGLFRVKYLAKNIFKGDVSCESTPGKGTRFLIELKEVTSQHPDDSS